MRKLLIGIGIVLVLLVAVALIVPSLVGTGQMTAFLTERLRASTGYNVAIRGPVALSVLPSPRLSVEDIHVTGPKPGAAEIARAGGIEVHVALLPLIDGRVEVTAVTVRDPVVSLDGPLDQAKPVPQAPPTPQTTSPPAPQAPAAAGGSKFSVAVRHVQVTNGSFAYRDGGRTYQADHLDLDLTTEANGAITGSADTSLGQKDALHLDGRLGALDCAQPVPLSLHGTAAAGGAKLDFDGTFRCGADQPTRAEGKLRFAADSLRAAAQPFTAEPLPAELDRRLTLDALLGAERTRVDLTELAFDLDQTHGGGMLAARLGDHPSADLTLDFNRIDLDRWLASLPAVAPPKAVVIAGPAPAPTAAKPAPVWPDGLHVGLDLSAELVSWRGGLIRQARFNGGIDQGTLTINQTTAELPGGTDVAVSGQLAGGVAAPHFTGTVDAETDDLRTVLGWAGVRLEGLPADRFRQASLSASLDLAGDRGAATGVELDLDGSRFKGAANLAFGGRPAIGLRLVGDQLNLDAYLASPPVLPGPAAVAAPPAPAAGAKPSSAVPLVVAAAALLPQVAANIDLTVDRITWRDQLLKAVHLAGMVEDGAVTVRDARIGDLAGGSLAFAGRWSGGFGSGASLSGQVSAGGASAAPLLTFAGLGGQDAALRLGPYRLDLKLDGRPDALDIDGALAAQDGHLTAKGRLDLANGAPHFAGALTLDHPEAARLVAFVAPLYRPAGGTLGRVALTVALDASADRARIDHLSLAIDGREIDGMATLDRTVAPPRLDADLTGSDLVLDPFLPAREVAAVGGPVRYAALGDLPPPSGRWSRAKLDLSALGLLDATIKLEAASVTLGAWQMDKPSLAVNLKGGTLGLDRLKGGLCGGSVDVHGSLGQPQTVPALALSVAGQDLNLKDLAQRLGSTALTGGSGGLKLDITTSGASEADLVAALAGTAALRARNGAVGGLDLQAVNARLKALKGPQDLVGVLQAVQGGGATAFSSLDATAIIAKGVARSTDLHLAADGGDLTGTVTVDLPAWTIDSQAKLTLAARPDLPPLAMDLSGPIDHPEKRIDVKSLAAYVEQQSGLGGLLKGLGGQQPATPASPSDGQPKPAQQLRDLFKGLTSKPNP